MENNTDIIKDIEAKQEPIFKSIFGEDWDDLPPVMRKHYFNRPYSDDKIVIEGKLDVKCSGLIKALSSLFWLMGGIPPHSEKDVPVTVSFESSKDSKEFHFNRVFRFKTAKKYCFKSRMVQLRGNEVLEIMKFGIGWRMNYIWHDGKVILEHKGYMLNIFGYNIPVPLTLLIGKGYAEEVPIDDNNFSMFVEITHPWWGKIYEYKGKFNIN